MTRENLLRLPEIPGTVIAVGDWWLIRLRPYEGAKSAWELLPFSSKAVHDRAVSLGIKAQCVYEDAWVLAEVEVEGYYTVISEPVTPYSFGYGAAEWIPEPSCGPVDLTACPRCALPILPGERRMSWFVKDVGNVTTQRGAVHVICPRSIR